MHEKSRQTFLLSTLENDTCPLLNLSLARLPNYSAIVKCLKLLKTLRLALKARPCNDFPQSPQKQSFSKQLVSVKFKGAMNSVQLRFPCWTFMLSLENAEQNQTIFLTVAAKFTVLCILIKLRSKHVQRLTNAWISMVLSERNMCNLLQNRFANGELFRILLEI